MAARDFPFTEGFDDARVEELKLLSFVAQHGSLSLTSVPDGPWHDLLVSLVWSNLLTAFSYEMGKRRAMSPANPGPNMGQGAGIAGESILERAMVTARVEAVAELYERHTANLHLTHWGRVRLSELKQALRAGREREPFGLLWDVRHWQRDLQIAILDTREESPLALTYLDMNGLKYVNDTYGHDEGDNALKAYFQAVASTLGDQGQAYRLGGDEVLVILPNHDVQATIQLLRHVCTKLMGERLISNNASVILSIAAGVVINNDSSAAPEKLRSAADKVQGRAKERSRETARRPSVIAVEGQGEMIVIE